MLLPATAVWRTTLFIRRCSCGGFFWSARKRGLRAAARRRAYLRELATCVVESLTPSNTPIEKALAKAASSPSVHCGFAHGTDTRSVSNERTVDAALQEVPRRSDALEVPGNLNFISVERILRQPVFSRCIRCISGYDGSLGNEWAIPALTQCSGSKQRR